MKSWRWLGSQGTFNTCIDWERIVSPYSNVRWVALICSQLPFHNSQNQNIAPRSRSFERSIGRDLRPLTIGSSQQPAIRDLPVSLQTWAFLPGSTRFPNPQQQLGSFGLLSAIPAIPGSSRGEGGLRRGWNGHLAISGYRVSSTAVLVL